MRLASDQREHRRGLVLGLTMAEVLLLLLFLLLLALASRLAQQAKKLESSQTIIKTLEPLLKSLSDGGQLTPQQVQDLAQDLADAARLRRENGGLQSQLTDASKRLEEFTRLEARANQINPNDPPATTLRKGLERVTPQFETTLAELRRRSQAQEDIEREARRINPSAPPEATIATALKQARPGAGDDEKLGGQIKERMAVLRDTEERLNRELKSTLGGELDTWKAELDPKSLTLRFNRPDLLFEQGKATLRPGFEGILNQLFPEYLRILYRFKDDIEEVRIEGHTSSEWGAQTGLQAYFPNMALSQERTRAVLEYGLTKTDLPPDIVEWGRKSITANGLSSSRPRATAKGAEDSDASRRVEFRVLMRAKEQLLQIVEPGVR